MITVANKKSGATGEYIGRPSPLGNPFVIGRDGARADVIRKYRRWIEWNIDCKKESIIQEISRLYEIWQRTGKLTLL